MKVRDEFSDLESELHAKIDTHKNKNNNSWLYALLTDLVGDPRRWISLFLFISFPYISSLSYSLAHLFLGSFFEEKNALIRVGMKRGGLVKRKEKGNRYVID